MGEGKWFTVCVDNVGVLDDDTVRLVSIPAVRVGDLNIVQALSCCELFFAFVFAMVVLSGLTSARRSMLLTRMSLLFAIMLNHYRCY